MTKKTKKMLDLSFKVERSNELNQLSTKGLNLTEIRFLAIYQAKINARNPETRIVTFPLAEFCRIMELSQLTVTHIKNVADGIICKPVHLPSTKGKNGFIAVPLFSKCEVYQDDKLGEWFVEIRCSEEVMPYMFEMKKNYFTYQLWNALKLKSVNQIRMYEILKQCEKLGERIVILDDLKAMLGIGKEQYPRFKDFRKYVIEVCQQALEQYTDIKYTFETIKRGRKIYALKFTITKNKNFKDDLKLKEFIKPEDLEDIQIDAIINSLYQRCKKEYTIEQLEKLYDYVSNCGINISNGISNYIYSIYAKIKISGNKVNNLFKYTFSIIKDDIDRYIFDNNNGANLKSNETCISSYDIDEVVRSHNIQHRLEEESVKLPIEPSKVEEVHSSVDVPNNNKEKISDFPILEFKFFYDDVENSFVSFTSCSRLQMLLERKYHKEGTYWLLEEPFTQQQVIDLIFKKHQVIVVPKPLGNINDFEEVAKNYKLESLL